MAFIFGGGRGRGAARSPLREQQAQLQKSVRAADREDARASAEERRLAQEIRRQAAQGHVDQCMARGKELVRVRAHRGRLGTMRGHMTGLAQQLSSVQGTQRMAEILAKTALAMRSLNQQMDPRAVQRMLLEYERQSGMLAVSHEAVDEGLDATLELDGETDATDTAVADVFRDLGLEALAGQVASRAAAAPSPPIEDEALEVRLARLRAAT
jgi:hypothetical protein